ncbi:hypothetical protein M8J76_006336 [Diaphorina citri]|nr:hypothetical protein M8J76_006336 [Diaphorina citri]
MTQLQSELFENEEICHQLISSHQPTQSLLIKLSQVALDSLLEHISVCLESNEKSINELGRWIYAVMVYLETPLVPEMHHNLRTIAKRCRSLREKTDQSKVECLAALNLFITLISLYFGQSDLGDSL